MKTPNQTAFAPTASAKELSNQFLSSIRTNKRKFSGSNDVLDGASYAIGLLTANREDFTASRYLSLTRAYCDSIESTQSLLSLLGEWLAFLQKHGKIEREFVIDEATFRWKG